MTLSTTSDAEKMQNASRVAKQVLGAFPDYAKTTPEYTLAIVRVIASYPPWVQSKLADLRTGIPAKCKFLPTVADIVEMADRMGNNQFGGMALRDYSGLVVDDRPYHPEIVPYVSNRPTRNPAHYQGVNADQEKTKEGIRRAERMTAYVRELGDGDGLKGWMIAIERGEDEPPADWQPK